jgi:3-oxoacyl-[acyl-carrier protein] reductase
LVRSTLRNIVVTGATRGLGLAIAQRAARSGFRVIAIARSESQALRDAMVELPGLLHFRSCDLLDLAAFPGLARTIRDDFGPVYGLVNNAGIGTAAILSTMPDDAIERVIRMNVTSPLTLTKYLVRPMMTARAGRVVNVSSIVSSTGYSGLAAYGASKAALVGFTRSLARELGSLGITVNAVAPGFVDTEMTHDLDDKQRAQISRRSALRRLAGAEDVAAAVDFLLGDSAGNITGTVMTVDAGSTA